MLLVKRLLLLEMMRRVGEHLLVLILVIYIVGAEMPPLRAAKMMMEGLLMADVGMRSSRDGATTELVVVVEAASHILGRLGDARAEHWPIATIMLCARCRGRRRSIND
jgi:hypothetical protein